MTNKIYDDEPFKGSKTITEELQDYLFEDQAKVKSVVRELIEDANTPRAVPSFTVLHSTDDFTTFPIETPKPFYTNTVTGLSSIQTGYVHPKPTEKKDTNPKDAVGIRKVAFSTVPHTVMAEVGVGMMEGARKYGRHNWRAAEARASVYFDATLRHLLAWYEGEDIDPGSNLSHVTKAITSLVVLRDAMINDKWNDDRPPKIPADFWNGIQERVDDIFEKYPTALDPITEWSIRNALPKSDSL